MDPETKEALADIQRLNVFTEVKSTLEDNRKIKETPFTLTKDML